MFASVLCPCGAHCPVRGGGWGKRLAVPQSLVATETKEGAVCGLSSHVDLALSFHWVTAPGGGRGRGKGRREATGVCVAGAQGRGGGSFRKRGRKHKPPRGPPQRSFFWGEYSDNVTAQSCGGGALPRCLKKNKGENPSPFGCSAVKNICPECRLRGGAEEAGGSRNITVAS